MVIIKVITDNIKPINATFGWDLKLRIVKPTSTVVSIEKNKNSWLLW